MKRVDPLANYVIGEWVITVLHSWRLGMDIVIGSWKKTYHKWWIRI